MGWDEYWSDADAAKLDRDRVVTLTVGQLTDALAEALKVVSGAPQWEVGDRAFVEVEVVENESNSFVEVKFLNSGIPYTLVMLEKALKEIA